MKYYNSHTQELMSKPSWITEDGKPVSVNTEAKLIEHGYYPYINERPVINPETHKLIKGGIEVLNNQAVQQYNEIPLTEQEIKARKKALVPSTITRLQGEMKLKLMGLYDTVMAKISENPDHQFVFERTSTWSRNGQLIAQMSQALNLTEDFVDDFFINAVELSF